MDRNLLKHIMCMMLVIMFFTVSIFHVTIFPLAEESDETTAEFVDELTDVTKIYNYDSTLLETEWSNDKWLLADTRALIPKAVGNIPVITYKLDNEIKGFSIDTVYAKQSVNGVVQWATDFTFEISANGEDWTPVTAERTDGTEKNPGGGAIVKEVDYSVSSVATGNYYLKITFGDNTNVKKRWAVALDTVKIYYESDVAKARSALDLGDISAITENDVLELPTEGEYDTSIEWESADESVLSIDKNSTPYVATADEDAFYGCSKKVTLTATISKEGLPSLTKTFDVTVVRRTDGWGDEDFAAYYAENLPFSYLTGEDKSAVASPITLPTGIDGVTELTFTWSITESEAAVITDNVLKFTPQKEPTAITLTLTADYNGSTATNSYNLTVIKGGYLDGEVYSWEDTLTAGSYDEKTMVEDSSIINTETAWTFPSDGQGITAKAAGDRPVVIAGPFDDAIYGFEVDTSLQLLSGEYATDFIFEASSDGISYDVIPSYYIAKKEEKIAVGAANYTIAEHIFSPANMDVSKYYRYLKITFGDNTSVSDSKGKLYRTAANLDGIKVHFETDVTKAYNALTFDELTLQNIDEVKTSLNTPPAADNNYGVSIEWESSDEDVLSSATGVVDTSKFYGYSMPVKLTATLSKAPETVKGGVTRTKEFDITVVRTTDGWTPQQYVDYDVLKHEDKECLTFKYFTEQPENMVATSIHLPRELEGGGSFTWNVTDADANPTAAAQINNYIMSFTPQKTQVTPLQLTVTSEKDGASQERTFDIELVRGFSDNLLLNAKKISATSSGINKALSRDVVTFWETTPEDTAKTVNIEFSDITKINSGLIVENGANISGIEILTSEDGSSYKNVYTGTSNGDKVREAFSFPEVECKYVKIIFNSENPVSLHTLELYYEIITDGQIMSYSLEDINIPASTSSNITLPTVGKYGGTIAWTTSDASVITNTGVITQAVNENKSAVLTAVLSYKGVSSEPKTFTITVSGKIEIGGGGGSSGSGGGGGGGASGGSVGAKEFEEAIKENTQASSAASFADVSENHWAHSYITELTTSGIISKADNYRPSDKVTREEFVKLIIAATGGIDSDTQSQGFTDTDNTAWYYPYITAAHDRGIVTGNVDGSFGIGTTITRQDAAAMLYRAIENKNTHDKIMTFTDGGVVSVYAAEAITYLANEGILSGYEDGSFRPFDNLTRAESAKIIYMLSTLAKEDSNAQ